LGRENPNVAEFSFTASETDKVSKIYRAKDIMTTFKVPFYYEIKSKRTKGFCSLLKELLCEKKKLNGMWLSVKERFL